MPAELRAEGSRQDTWITRLYVNGQSFGIWDKKTGGEVDSDDVKYYPGGMLPPIMLGGKITTGNVTLQRLYDRVDDHGKINTLIAAAGRGKVTIHQRPMDQFTGEEFGATINYEGRLKRVNLPDVDSESTTAGLYEIEATINGLPSAA